MALDINAIKGRLNKLQNTQKKSDLIWKPTAGKTQVRIVPYKFSMENPFIELFFHYNVNNKTYVSPISFGRPDPISEFAEKLKRMGDKDDWKAAKAMEPKLRTFVPVLVRGEENLGIRFWGFGKTVYQEILGYIADPDYGDITHPLSGRDITIEYTESTQAGTFPVTTIRVKPSASPMLENEQDAMNLIQNQTEITDLYPELSYDELAKVLNDWLNPAASEDVDDETGKPMARDKAPQQSVSEVLSSKKQEPVAEPKQEEAPKKSAPAETSAKSDDVAKAFATLFNKK